MPFKISRSEFPLGNGSPGYQLMPDPPSPTGAPCLWADTQIGAIFIGLGADYVQACLEGNPEEIQATQAAINKALASLR